MYLRIDNDRVIGFSRTPMSPSVFYDDTIPEDFIYKYQSYRLVDGKLMFDEDYKELTPVIPENVFDKALRLVIDKLDITDDELLEIAGIYPDWLTNKEYKTNDKVQYNDQLYRIMQQHTSQQDWTPDITPALYKLITYEGDILIWSQPQGAHDAYHAGDIVKHQDLTWKSEIDSNVYEPGVYGWSQIEV